MKETTAAFAEIAREFCEWAESAPLSEEEEARKAIWLIARLYTHALALAQPASSSDVEGEGISDDEWRVIFKRFGALPFNYYLEFFNPANTEDEEHVIGDLADDLADIYRDIKEGLGLYEKGFTQEALWEWKQSFDIHWGRHATSALHSLHAYASDHGIQL